MTVLIVCLLLLSALVAWHALVRPLPFLSGGKARGGSAERSDDPDRAPPCKETCDIHGKVGEPIRYDCGHDDAPEFKIDLWGEPKFHKKPHVGKLLCSDCLLKEVLKDCIRCGNCGYAIMPGDPISLCVDDRRIGKKAWRTVFDGQRALCLRWDCEAGSGYCGHWTGKGIKPLFPDGGNMISQAAKSGEPVFVQIGRDDKEGA